MGDFCTKENNVRKKGFERFEKKGICKYVRKKGFEKLEEDEKNATRFYTTLCILPYSSKKGFVEIPPKKEDY